ncbi:MAG TPA: L,D-transpeptidase family protein [Candidatus Merdenecus merdavium]|nr:L,D-transpeptidase family protein [Candidatus Merdenecus merdavium]
MKKKSKIIIASSVGIVGVLFLIIFLVVSHYFKDKFYFHTNINGIPCAGMTVEEVEELLRNRTENFKIDISTKSGEVYTIEAADIQYQYSSDGSIQRLKKMQNPYHWISSYFKKDKSHHVSIHTTFDLQRYQKVFESLPVFDEDKVQNPKDAYVTYEDGEYSIVEEEEGNKVLPYVLYHQLIRAIKNGDTKVSLERIGAYEKPGITKNVTKLIDYKERLNRVTQARITYDFGDTKEVLDRSVLSQWVKINPYGGVYLDVTPLKEYIGTLASTYDTYNLPKEFKTHDGSMVTVRATKFGHQMDQEEELKILVEKIELGAIEEREPVYIHQTESRYNSGLGDTYVEIDMTNQRMWFYKDGVEVVSSDIVTGNLQAGYRTPEGTYKLYYKTPNTVLRGEDYASPVKYWMPFNGGIGLHDASWRWKFGGEIYKTGGSHGCINMPTEEAGRLYEQITAGTPIICYYRK